MTARAAAAEAERLLGMIHGNWTTQAVGVAAELGIADALSAGPVSLDALAERTACDRGALGRLMRSLESLALCEAQAGDRYALTPGGELLRRDVQPSLRSWAIWNARFTWTSWGRLLECVKTGQSARKLFEGREGYAHLADDPAAASVFHGAMVEMTGLVAGLVARDEGLADCGMIVDVGGGHGELLAAILAAHPRACGVVFDLAHAREGARAQIDGARLGSRCQFVAGSFFDAVPGDADIYLLKSILHNWDDAKARQILERCREAMKPAARLVIVERVLPDHPGGTCSDHLALRSDLNMLVGLGGRERTQAEFESLLASAGLALRRATPLALAYSLIEASRD
jgi:hypothetical protein